MMNLRMPSINKVIISGNLTDDPSINVLESGTNLAKFRIANNQRFRGRDGQWRDKTCYVDVVAWRRTAELVGQFCSKGSPVLIEGELVYSEWDDRDGNRRSRVEINARRVQFLERRDSGSQDDRGGHRETRKEPARQPEEDVSYPDDDIPF